LVNPISLKTSWLTLLPFVIYSHREASPTFMLEKCVQQSSRRKKIDNTQWQKRKEGLLYHVHIDQIQTDLCNKGTNMGWLA
jgi:hypothetical protein